jgi:hypothetical protein
MTQDIAQIAAATAAILAPFTPLLIEAAKFSGKALAEMVVQKGGEAAWKKAQALWNKLRNRCCDDPEMTSIVTLVAANPEDEARQTMLAEVLGARLQQDPRLAQDLFDLLGKQQAMQEILADRSSWVEDVTQRIKGTGIQRVQSSQDSVIVGVRQIKQ